MQMLTSRSFNHRLVRFATGLRRGRSQDFGSGETLLRGGLVGGQGAELTDAEEVLKIFKGFLRKMLKMHYFSTF